MKNDLFLRALRGETVERTPLWMMRQAGRFLPDYRVLREKYSFFERIQTPELVSEITIMPIQQVHTDAAILFSDILVIPQAMGLEVEMVPGFGPKLPKVIKNKADIDALIDDDDAIVSHLDYVAQGIQCTLQDLNGDVPLIGFAGAPFTLLCYMIQGKGSKDFSEAKSFCFAHPEWAHELLAKITKASIAYMQMQIQAGVQAFQVFDSWAGLLDEESYKTFALPYCEAILDECTVPSILFAKGAWHSLEAMNATSAFGIGLDWNVSAEFARAKVPNKVLQGNFDPSFLFGTKEFIETKAIQMVHAFGKEKYIANLGHGILPTVPVENAQLFIETVKEESSKL